ncbi:MAG TPA: hypothetical protein VMT16_15960 [Thermoanaerobaculia bacterium]|nr:hypothetical protein [Thermoanaerobaculia bacterium]
MTDATTLAFQAFWTWLTGHPNCIVRAGTPEAVLYDDEDLHWHFTSEGPQMLLVQVLRGKRFVGELFLDPEQVDYVQATPGEVDGEFLFELIAESETDSVATFFFVLSHGYDVQEPEAPRRVH